MKVNIIDNDLLSIQEARILTENAYEAQQKLATFPQEKLDEIVEAMAQAALSHAKELAVMSAEETKKLMTNGGLVQAVHVAAMYYAEKLLNK